MFHWGAQQPVQADLFWDPYIYIYTYIIYIYTYIHIYIYMISENINGSYRTIHDYKIFTYFRSTTGLGGDIFRLRNASRADPHRVTLSLCAAQAQRRIAAIRRWLCQPALTGVPAVDRTDHNCMHLGGP